MSIYKYGAAPSSRKADKILDREQIRRDFQDCIVGYDSSINTLMKLGMSEAEADDFLIPPEQL